MRDDIPADVVAAVIQELFRHTEPEGQVHLKLAVAKMENANLRAALDAAQELAASTAVAAANGETPEPVDV